MPRPRKGGDRQVFKVTLTMPDGVSLREMREYIRDAVAGWKGQFNNGLNDRSAVDPLFLLDGDSVKVKRVQV